MRSVVLFYPKTGSGAHRIPLPVLAVASTSLESGYDIKVIDERVDPQCFDKLRTYSRNAICVGISSMTGFQIVGGLKARVL